MYTPLNYSPTEFTDKNDAHVSTSVSLQGVNGFIAYTPVKNAFVFTEGNYVYSGNSKQQIHQSYSVGIGGYYSIQEKIHFEARIGYGEGKFEYADGINGSSDNLTNAVGFYFRPYAAVSMLYKADVKAFGFFFNIGELNNHYISTNHGVGGGAYNIQEKYLFTSIYSGFIYKKYFTDGFGFIFSLGANLVSLNPVSIETKYRFNPVYTNFGLTFNLQNFIGE
jgi:hypothetical protein